MNHTDLQSKNYGSWQQAMLNVCKNLLQVSMYVQMNTMHVQPFFFSCMRLFVCKYVCCLCPCVQDASGCLWYFTFPFRQRVSWLAPNEPITGSSIWCVLYGSLGSTISTDESWESVKWVGQLGEKMHECMCIQTRRAVSWLHETFFSSQIPEWWGLGIFIISSHIIMIFP